MVLWFMPEAKASVSFGPEAKASVSFGTDFYRARFASVLRLKPSEKSTRGVRF